MWIERPSKKDNFIKSLLHLDRQVLLVQGARQVGKTSFTMRILHELSDHPQIKLNLYYPTSFRLGGVDYYGRDFFGDSPTGEIFLKNIETELGGLKNLKKPALIFVDEADQYAIALEAIQTLAEFSRQLKFVFTGSNLENIQLKNAATGRKKYFDLYPITFKEFLNAAGLVKLSSYFENLSFDKQMHSAFYHDKLMEQFQLYLRLGGMPRIVDAYLDPASIQQPISEIIKDLAVTIEENVKTVLGQTAKLYEYEDILRKLAYLSMNTLKYTHLQVQHAGRSEAKKLVAKTVGARVAHKIRLYESGSDLSKYILFDCGLVHYLLNGADLLKTTISDRARAILCETFVGNELIAGMITRDDLFYWKSANKAEVEFFLKSPQMMGIDVKVRAGDHKSLNSLALLESDTTLLVKVSEDMPIFYKNYGASLPNHPGRRIIPMMQIPHYLVGRLPELVSLHTR